MHRLRSTWLALMGGALLIALSVSTAFGAPPNEKDTRGQKVSSFVHELIFGSEEETDEDEVVEEEPADEDEDGSEDEDSDDDESTDDDDDGSEEDEDAEEGVDEEVDEDGEETADREVPDGFANHGKCVSAAAHDTDGFEESETANKGEWVSMHARYVCWGLDVPGEEPEEDVDEEDSTADEDEDADEASAKEQRKAERAAARAERKAEQAAAREARHAERHVAKAANRGGGKNKGH